MLWLDLNAAVRGLRATPWLSAAAIVALALGIGPNTAIFIIEDDAQDGPDHVDARRTAGLVISPYVKRGVVDSTLYSTSSYVRSIELLLGMPPMSQYDAAAMPMYAAPGLDISVAVMETLNYRYKSAMPGTPTTAAPGTH